MDIIATIQPLLNTQLTNSLVTGHYKELISLNGKVYALKLELIESSTPISLKKSEFFNDRYREYNICIDIKGYMWTKPQTSGKEDETEPLANISYNTLTCMLRNDYKKWCKKENIIFNNSDFQLFFDRTLHNVFRMVRASYRNPEKAMEAGYLKKEYMDENLRL